MRKEEAETLKDEIWHAVNRKGIPINVRVGGKEYWETKWNRVPAKYLELEVYSWSVWSAYRGIDNNKYREGERINITALPSGQTRPEPEPREKKPQQEEDSNQMTIDDWFRENGKEKA